MDIKLTCLPSLLIHLNHYVNLIMSNRVALKIETHKKISKKLKVFIYSTDDCCRIQYANKSKYIHEHFEIFPIPGGYQAWSSLYDDGVIADFTLIKTYNQRLFNYWFEMLKDLKAFCETNNLK